MRFRYVRDVPEPVRVYEGKLVGTGDVVEYEGHFAGKASRNPDFEDITEAVADTSNLEVSPEDLDDTLPDGLSVEEQRKASALARRNARQNERRRLARKQAELEAGKTDGIEQSENSPEGGHPAWETASIPVDTESRPDPA